MGYRKMIPIDAHVESHSRVGATWTGITINFKRYIERNDVSLS